MIAKSILVVFLAWGNVAQLNGQLKKTVGEKVATFFENKCLKNGNEDAYTDLTNENALKNCILDNIARVEDKGEFIDMFCTEFRDGVYDCFESVVQKLESCLEPEEKFLGRFLLTAHNLTYNKGCANYGEIIENTIARLRNEECAVSLLSLPSLLLPDCSSSMRLVKHLDEANFIITKDDLCSDLIIVKECFINGAKKYCGEDTVNADVMTYLLDSYLVSC